MLRSYPHAEDHGSVAGGDTSGLLPGLARPISLNAPAFPPGNDGVAKARRSINSGTGEIENDAQRMVSEPDGVDLEGSSAKDIDFLRLIREAEDQALLYQAQVNRKAWSQSYRAHHNEHYIGSKYTKPDWRGRSKLFVPHTRAAVRKDNAAVAASLFNNIDAISCQPGNDADPRQRGAAAVMQELVNHRTSTASGKAAFPWFLVSMGSRQDAVITGVCCTKQTWKQVHRKTGQESVFLPDETGVYEQKTRDVFALEVDRPDMVLIPPENYVIDPAANWTDPAQSSAFLVIKWPMQIEEIKAKQTAPFNPWKEVAEEVLKNSVESGKWDMAAIRRARELGLDRLDETQTGTHFQIIWVYEAFLRVDGEDYTFYSVGDQQFLTDPKPVREVYPEQFGERPVVIGYGSLESHRIYPMAPVESWQPLQLEINDIRNLQLDATKQNVMPISKVRRGRQIDLDQVKRRSSGSSILVQEPDDVTWEQPPTLPESSVEMSRELSLEFDDLAGQQNYGSVETNNALGKTLGGLKLAAGAANATSEFDIRLWIETWASRALNQIVRLEQYYEQDAAILGLAGQKAQLFEKFGINQIDDKLLEENIVVHVSVGLGAGDPQQRLQKFETAANIIAPILQQSPDFTSGKKQINVDAIIEEVFGACGYKDGGSRFFSDNPNPSPNPMQDLQTEFLKSRIAKENRTGQAALFTGLSNLAKVALGKRELESDVVDRILSRQIEARETGFDHAHRHMDQHLAATDAGHRHGMAIVDHRRNLANDALSAAQQASEQAAQGGGGDVGMGGSGPSPQPQPGAGPQGQPSASPPPAGPAQTTMSPTPAGPQGGPPPGALQLQHGNVLKALGEGGLKFTRGPDGRINGLQAAQQDNQASYPLPATTPVMKTRQMAQQAQQQQAAPAPAPAAAQPAPEPQPDPNEERFAKMEEMLSTLGKKHADLSEQHAELQKAHAEASKPRKRVRNVVRDDNNRIVRLEDEEVA
jgi:hypothetical protein